MADNDTAQEIESQFIRFVDPHKPFPQDVLAELQSILRQLSTDPYDLFLKWEAYSIKMGSEDTKLDLDTVRLFKQDLIESLPQQIKTKSSAKASEKKANVGSTPRPVAQGDGLFDMLDSVVSQTPRPPPSSTKRKAGHSTPAPPSTSTKQPSSDFKTPSRPADSSTNGTHSVRFAERSDIGQVTQQLGGHISLPEPPLAPYASSRLKLFQYTDAKRFSYRPMAMHLSAGSDVLDRRINKFTELVKSHMDVHVRNPCSISTAPIIAVGRIAADTPDKRLTDVDIVLETSRETAAGRRVPLDFVPSVQAEVFPGQIVALKGINPTGKKFTVEEVLSFPDLFGPASEIQALDAHTQRLHGEDDADSMDIDSENTALATTTLLASGPYTADDNLDFEPLHALIDQARDLSADAVVLTGPFLDVEHPMIASGDFDLPDDLDPDEATLITLFRHLISKPLASLTSSLPSLNLVLIPSVRDAASHHISWPQDALAKKELGLPRQAQCLTNPTVFSLNEVMFGISSQDILNYLRLDLRRFPRAPPGPDMAARLVPHLISQRHFFPMFPPFPREGLPRTGVNDGKGMATGPMLDIAQLELAEWTLDVKPDILVTPSSIGPFAKIVQGVVTINPGSLSRRRGPGTYARLTVQPLAVSAEERESGEVIPHRVFERARVDIVRI